MSRSARKPVDAPAIEIVRIGGDNVDLSWALGRPAPVP
jgi:hypothetical protein